MPLRGGTGTGNPKSPAGTDRGSSSEAETSGPESGDVGELPAAGAGPLQKRCGSDLFAQYERALIRGRTKAALAVKKAKGERTGGVPYGFRAEGKRLVEDAGEQATVARARELRRERRSLRQIARSLVADGHLPRNGRTWAIQTIRRLVARV